uniref:Secreted protein n=1 Tax=Anopheles culicifacies TaxID=139723 RepID=A0A182MB72_9DIPT
MACRKLVLSLHLLLTLSLYSGLGYGFLGADPPGRKGPRRGTISVWSDRKSGVPATKCLRGGSAALYDGPSDRSLARTHMIDRSNNRTIGIFRTFRLIVPFSSFHAKEIHYER